MKKGFLQIHTAVLLFGFTAILGRAISLSAPVLVWYRMMIASIILLFILWFRKERIHFDKKDLKMILFIGIIFAVHWVTFYGSVKLANASVAVVCLASASVFTALFDPLFTHGKLNKKEVLLGLLALVGVLCIYLFHADSIPKGGEPMVNFRWGLLSGLIAAIISSIFSILSKPLAEKYPPRPLVFLEMAAGFLFLTLLLPFFIHFSPDSSLTPIGWDYLWLLLLGYFCTVWAQSLLMQALKHLSAFTITLSVNLEPIYAIILAFVIFHENNQLGSGFYLGLFFILTSVALQAILTIQRTRKRSGKTFLQNRLRYFRLVQKSKDAPLEE